MRFLTSLPVLKTLDLSYFGNYILLKDNNLKL